MSSESDKKELVSREALKFVSKGSVVGLGSGTTASVFIELLAKSSLRDQVACVSTSYTTEILARDLGLKTVDIDSVDWIDITVDGADEVDEEMNILKGGGGALTREKKVAKKSREYVIIVSNDKLVKRIPEKRGIPVEILHFGHKTTMKEIESLGLRGKLRENFLTDNGNLVCDFLPVGEIDIRKVNGEIKSITGVVETGLFLDMKKIVLVSDGYSVKKL